MSVILPNKLINGYYNNTGTGDSIARWKNIREITDSPNVFINDSGELSIGKAVPESDIMLSITQRLSNIDILKINSYGGSNGNLLSITKDGKFGFKINNPLDEFHVNSDSRFTGKLSVGYSTFEQVGNSLDIWQIYTCAMTALTSSRIAFIDIYNDKLRVYDFNGTNWSKTGNDYAISNNGYDAITALNSTDIAFIDGTNDELRTYRFDGSDWYQVGSGLSVPGIGVPALAALSSTTVAFVDSALDSLRKYEWNGSTWSQIGNSLNITQIHTPAITALNENTIAFADNYNDKLRTYYFNGSDWSLIGNELHIGCNYVSLAALNFTDIALIDTNNKEFRIYRWNGLDWIQFGIGLAISGLGVPCICNLNATDIAFVDDALDSLRTYRFTSTISLIADDNRVGIGIIPSDDSLEIRGTLGDNLLKISASTGSSLLRLLETGEFGIGEDDPETKVEITDTEPFVTLHCDDETDNDESRKSGFILKGERSGGEVHALIKILAYHDGINDDEKACLAIYGNKGTEGNSPSLRLELDSDGNWKFGDGGVTNYVNISTLGINLFGTAQKWICLDLKPENIGLPSSSPPLRDEYQGFSFHRFDRSTEEQVFFIVHLKSDYAGGSASIRGHFGLIVENPPSGTGDEAIVMGYEYKKITPSDSNIFDFSSGTTAGTVTIPIVDGDPARKWYASPIGYCNTTGWNKEDIILFRFFRDSTNPNDTYDNEAVASDNDAWVGIYHLEYLLDGVGGN